MGKGKEGKGKTRMLSPRFYDRRMGLGVTERHRSLSYLLRGPSPNLVESPAVHRSQQRGESGRDEVHSSTPGLPLDTRSWRWRQRHAPVQACFAEPAKSRVLLLSFESRDLPWRAAT